MKVLLDEMLPVSFASHLIGHEVSTVTREDWKGLTNGALLARAADRGFEALVTADANMEYQQDLRKFALRVIVVPTQEIDDLAALTPSINAALSSAAPGRATRL
ncbi:MAG: DUF5615 family PIN-like protein [Chloroflexi bacterium]|nr:DUF5615 family PIN-like protein [Chloroflexota bacterium]